MKLNIWNLIFGASFVVQLVLLLLIFFSIVSWAIIFLKRKRLKLARKGTRKFLDEFWAERNMEVAYRKAEKMDFSPVAAVFRAGFKELQRSREHSAQGEMDSHQLRGLLENVERAMRRSSTRQLTILERRISFLATTGSSAPFIGLFGTVWGIMRSFIEIGKTGATNLAVVAPGIAEALIATALGLFAAIPAVIGYNFCISQIRYLEREMDNFSNDFLNLIKNQLGGN